MSARITVVLECDLACLLFNYCYLFFFSIYLSSIVIKPCYNYNKCIVKKSYSSHRLFCCQDKSLSYKPVDMKNDLKGSHSVLFNCSYLFGIVLWWINRYFWTILLCCLYPSQPPSHLITSLLHKHPLQGSITQRKRRVRIIIKTSY